MVEHPDQAANRSGDRAGILSRPAGGGGTAGTPEEHHQTVAGKIFDCPPSAVNDIGHQRRDALHQRIGSFLSPAFGERGETDQVRKQDRGLSALAVPSVRRRRAACGAQRGL
jgi:hypothetical protein